jgi:WD40 repeat protein
VPDTLEVWDVRSRHRIVRRRPGANTSVVRFSPDGRLVAVGSYSGRARVWSTTTWKPVTRSFGPHAGVVSGAAISRDDRTLATGGDDGTVRLWDIQTGQAIGAPLPGQPNRPVVPSFTAGGTHLLAAYETGDAYLWDIIRPESLVRQACDVAGRRLTRAEWNQFLPGRDYHPAC